MIITEIIEKKRNGQVLKPEEIDFMINGLVNGEVADYQMTSFMMAVSVSYTHLTLPTTERV